jgi:hypothetical protein
MVSPKKLPYRGGDYIYIYYIGQYNLQQTQFLHWLEYTAVQQLVSAPLSRGLHRHSGRSEGHFTSSHAKPIPRPGVLMTNQSDKYLYNNIDPGKPAAEVSQK